MKRHKCIFRNASDKNGYQIKISCKNTHTDIIIKYPQ